jgi:DNA-binding NtrC family response regulator
MIDYEILIVDDEPAIVNSITKYFKYTYSIEGFTSPRLALNALREKHYHILMVDYKMPELSGLELFIEAKKINSYTYGILFTAYADKKLLAEVLNNNLVLNYIEKPLLDFAQLDNCFKEAINFCLKKQEQDREVEYIKEHNNELQKVFSASYDTIIGIENGLKTVYEKVKQISPFPINVLITGETGTGKDLFAHAIHRLSHRREGPYIPINCGAIPESLIESELFGYAKGAFTGALKDKPGKIELAHKGTLFLDEVADLKLDLQVKLLRVLEQKKIERIGSNHSISVDFRLVAASNKDFNELKDKSLFREDLFYRLNEVSLHLPPLRERKEDIKELAFYFMKKYSMQYGLNCPPMSSDAYNLLINHPWKGNIRELSNAIKQVIIYCSSRERIEPVDFSFLTGKPALSISDEDIFQGLALQVIYNHLDLKTIKKRTLEAVLHYYNGHVATAVKETGIKRDHFYSATSANGIAE